ncbi:hypothetical protein NQ315_007339, partial [Exocentrus adspersus]
TPWRPFLQTAISNSPLKVKALESSSLFHHALDFFLNYIYLIGRKKIFQTSKAPEETYLLLKVILIFGIYGTCRRSELLKYEDTERTSIISNLDHIKLYRQYYSLRPHYTNSRRFFIIGINKIRKAPKEIATYLRLPKAESYTGHCFRRSSAALLADSGADFVSLKRHGGWRSTTVPEGYIEESIEKKIKISNNILSATPNTSSAIVTSCTQENIILNNASVLPSTSQYCFNNCTITTFNLNATKVE